uniref:TNase-like domain-containing protein n=1 Tax=Photinus pyralis TaxID=7054 RepID=A0A1Y1M8B0_PHOPY
MTTYKDKINDKFNQFTSIMEANTRGVKIGCYSIALLGLTVAVRRVRPFSRFKRPSDIPSHFIKESRELTGTVEGVDPTKGLLLINHKPLLELPFTSPGALPVKLSGVHVKGHGISWLQAIVRGSQVKFIPVLKEKDWVQSEVSLDQLAYDKKWKTINVAESLVGIGFADLETPAIGSKRYCQQLHTAEMQAERKRLGLRYYVKPTREFVLKLGRTMYHFIASRTAKVVAVR